MPRTKASPVGTLLPHIIWLGAPALSVAAGSRPSIHVQCLRAGSLLCQSGSSRCGLLLVHPDSAGLQHLGQPVLAYVLVHAVHVA